MIDLEGVEYMNEYTAMPELLGMEVYQDENVNGMGDFGELGEPITLASIAAAAGVVAGIVAMLKDVGNIFQKKTKGAEDFDEKVNEDADKNSPVPINPPPTALPNVIINEATPTPDSNIPTELPVRVAEANKMVVKANAAVNENNDAVIYSNAAEKAVTNNADNKNTDNNNNNNNDNPGFWEKNKQWLKPVAIGVGGLTVIGIGYAMFKGSKTQNKSSPPTKSLSGAPNNSRKKNHQRNKSHKSKHHKKKAIALL
jgi:hypothetical protein